MANQNILNDKNEQNKHQIIRFDKSDYYEDIGNILEGNEKNKNELELDNYSTITTEIKNKIKEFKGTDIHLDGLQKLAPDDAKLLAGVSCEYLRLNGVENISKETAKELGNSKCKFLLLGGLSSLNKDTAKELSNYKGDIMFLDGIESIDEETAEEISKFKCRCIYLIGLKNITPNIKEKLENFKGTMRT